jgi:parvulin-like peptidyl-prolyl isomerase
VLKKALTIVVCCFLASCSVREKDNSVVLARVNDQVLTVKKLEKLLPPENRIDEQLKNFIHNWVDNALYYDAALRDGLHKDDRLSNERDRYYKKIVIGSYLQTKTSTSVAVSNSDIRKYYDKNPYGFIRQNDEAYVYHFFTKKHSDARSIRSRLLKKQMVDTTSELFDTYGVEKKTVTRGFLLKKLDIAIFKNKKGSIVGPIRTASGYHVIKIVKKYKKGSKVGLEGVYDKIYQRLLKQKQVVLVADLLDSLKEKSSVFINSNYQ